MNKSLTQKKKTEKKNKEIIERKPRGTHPDVLNPKGDRPAMRREGGWGF
jgi:hypothetical protein